MLKGSILDSTFLSFYAGVEGGRDYGWRKEKVLTSSLFLKARGGKILHSI